MKQVYRGRYTAEGSEEFIVFLIGMRVNSPLAVHKWLPVAAAMPKMLQALYEDQSKGFLGGESFFRLFPITTLLVSYWKSFEALENFAKNPKEPHFKSWTRFMQKIGSDGSVGIWHETYKIQTGNWETIYGNMPRFGLGKALKHVSISKETQTARSRIKI